MKRAIKGLLHALLGEYAAYRVWRLDGQQPAAAAAADSLQVWELQPADLQSDDVNPQLARCGWYLGAQARGFGCFEQGRLLGVAFYWWGARYAQRHSWPIPDGAAKLVHIVTIEQARGRGVAPRLIRDSARLMQQAGHRPLYARIWHNNHPSQRAFARAGWTPVGWLFQINPLRRPTGWSLRWPPRRR